jgi:outer membrane autotransporter protein
MTPQPAFAIFQAAPGTVTVSNAQGAVAVTGMQFASDGYVVQGDAIELAGPQAVLRVGDGSGAHYTATISAALTGSANLDKTDVGTLVLTGANSYSGGTTISGGTLVGNAGSFGSGAIVDNAALVIDQAGDGTLSNAISGNGRLAKSGAGTLTLAGDSAGFAGSTQVTAGTLAVTGALGGTLTMGSGTLLKGNGTIGTTLVQAGATVAPGNSIGTLHVAGDLTLAQGSVYQVEASPDGRSDQIRATGRATLQGGAVQVLAAQGDWSPSTGYTILSADGGVDGQFGGVTSNLAFLDPFLSYEAQSVALRLQRNDVSFRSVGATSNQRASGGAVEGLLRSAALYGAVVQLDAPSARGAFDQLSGEVHASLKSAAIEDSRFVREAAVERVRQAFGGVAAPADPATGSGVWAHAFGAHGNSGGDGNAASIDRSTSGLLIGADTRVGDDWRLGVLGGYSHSRVELGERASSASSDSHHLGVYGGRQWGPLGLRIGASHTQSSIDTQRAVIFNRFADTPTASYKARTTQVFSEFGWRFDSASGALEPFVGLAHADVRTDGFAERGGAAALSADGSRTATTFSTLGLRGSSSFDVGGGQLTLRGMVGWRHAFGGAAPNAAVALAGQPAFAVGGVPIARNVAVIEGGVDFALRPGLTLGVSYTGQKGGKVEDHGLKANLVWKF